ARAQPRSAAAPARARSALRTSDSPRLSERSERSSRSEFRGGAGAASIAGHPREAGASTGAPAAGGPHLCTRKRVAGREPQVTPIKPEPAESDNIQALMHLLTLGLNHQTAPLGLRERVSFPGETLRAALADLRQRLYPIAPESAILSTCNRTEIYCATRQPHEAQVAIAGWLDRRHEIEGQGLQSHLYALPNGEAVRHAFRVAAGLDSMVLGEPQILGQMK